MAEFALITGASSGIGYYFAHELAKRKLNVLIIARSEDKLIKLREEISNQYTVQCHYLLKDLSHPDAAREVYDWCATNQYKVNILINNAGYGLFGYFEKQPIAEINNMMNLNMNTLVALCHVFLPMLKENSKSYILNVASTAAYQAVPTLNTYAATKAFVLLFTRGLRHELKGTSVSVSCISPGATDTNFIQRAGLEAIKEKADKFSMRANEVAKIGIAQMFKGKAEIIPGLINIITSQLTQWVPKSLTERIAANIYKDALK
ncbi:MAG: SDR family oxidoreductase [Cyclobacteriaceae bacterium]|jgi:hypothetical protein|nr:SDR family oxidoreductase [Cyclobacteriaceae bacterium]